MSDLNMMMREQARNGLQTQLDTAVTNGDAEAARKIMVDIEKLAVSTAPKAPPYGDAEIRSELNKLDWFGVDPKKSGRAIALGRDMDPKKFSSAEAFAAALVKAVEAEDKPAGKAAAATEETEEEEGEGTEETEETEERPAKSKRKTDGPGEGDTLGRGAARAKSGPWAKLSDAPSDIQKEINRTADKFAPKTKEGREGFVNKALGAHYAEFQRKKGKK